MIELECSTLDDRQSPRSSMISLEPFHEKAAMLSLLGTTEHVAEAHDQPKVR